MPSGSKERANKSINSVKYVSKIQIPKYYGNNMSIKKPETHIFFMNHQKLTVALLTSELPKKQINQKFHWSLVKVD